MKVDLFGKDAIMIVPETDFEMQWLSRLGHENEKDLSAYHKCGLSTRDYLGIKIEPKNTGEKKK